MIFKEIDVSGKCINIDSYGEICLNCGCCDRNKNYKDMIRRRIQMYRKRLKDEYDFPIRDEFQKRIIKANIKYFKRKIRLYKKIMKTL